MKIKSGLISKKPDKKLDKAQGVRAKTWHAFCKDYFVIKTFLI
jgi:hypothetical protein